MQPPKDDATPLDEPSSLVGMPVISKPEAEREADPQKVLLLCERCWRTFNGWVRPLCPECGARRPVQGWATVPYTFRDRYLFVEPLGRGGMGAVFLAYDQQQAAKEKRPVAVKVVPHSTSRKLRERLKTMFEREASAAAMLGQSPFFVRVTSHDVGVEPAYLVMECVRWPTLRDLLRPDRKLPPRALSPIKVARVAVALLRGVSIMHFHRIVHRDLKPDNIFVRRSEEEDGYEVKILDFGVWTQDVIAADAPSRSVSGLDQLVEAAPVGTFSYMSPEQLASRPVGVSSDLHTIGSLLWELATGRVPYPMPKGDELVGIRDRLLRLSRPPARPAEMPEGFYEILVRALSDRPETRWESAEEMRAAFKVWLAEQLLRSRSEVDQASHRLNELRARAQGIREEFKQAGTLSERIDALSDSLSAIHEQADEADIETLSRCTEKAEASLIGLTHEVEGFADRIKGRLRGSPDRRDTPTRRSARGPAFGKERRFAFTGLRSWRVRILLLFALTTGVSTAAASAWIARALSGDPQEHKLLPRLLVAPGGPEPVEPPPVAGQNPEIALGDGHSGGSIQVAYSPDARFLASSSDDLSIVIRDARSGAVLRRLTGHGRRILDLTISGDSHLLGSASADGTVRLWELQTGRTVRTLAVEGLRRINSIAFSADGRYLAAAANDGVTRLWELGSGRLVRQFGTTVVKKRRGRKKRTRPAEVLQVAFSPHGQVLVTADLRGQVVLWDPLQTTPLRELSPHVGPVRALAFSDDGRTVASAGDDKMIIVSNVETGESTKQLQGHEASIGTLEFSSDGRRIYSGSDDGTIRLWTVTGEAEPEIFKQLPEPLRAISLDPMDRWIAVGGRSRDLRVFDTKTGQTKQHHRGRSGAVLAVEVHPKGHLLASATIGGTIDLIDAESGRLLDVLGGHKSAVTGIAFSNDGRYLVSGSRDETVRVWPMDRKAEARTLKFHSAAVAAVAFSPDGTMVASSDADGRVRIASALTGQSLHRYQGGRRAIHSLHFSPDGRYLAAGGDDRRVRVWRLDDEQLVRSYEHHRGPIRALRFSPDGRTIASAGEDRSIRVTGVDNGETILSHRGHTMPIRGLSFSPDGARIATASLDGTIKIWASRKHRLVSSFTGHGLGVTAIAFFPSGTHLMSGSYDSTRRVWDRATGHWVSMANSPDGWQITNGH